MAQTIFVNTNPIVQGHKRLPTLTYSQGDVGRVWNIALSADFVIPSGATFKMEATKPSGFGFSSTGTYDDGVVSFVTTADMTDEAGRFEAEIKISNSGLVIGTANFWLVGEEDPHPEGTTDGQAESVIPTLTLLVQRIEAAAASIHDLSVDATTLLPNTPATATYDEETNEITFGIPRGAQLMAADDGNGNITLTFS